MGHVPDDHLPGNSTATYSLDGGPPVRFTVPGLAPDGFLQLYEQPFFTVQNLDPEAVHEIEVTYHGTSAPLVFSYLQVDGGEIIQSLVRREPAAKKAPVGPIAGGVVGGVVFLLVLLGLVLLLRRRNRRKAAKAAAAVDLSIASPPERPLVTYEISPLVLPEQAYPTPSMPKAAGSTVRQQTVNPPSFERNSYRSEGYAFGQPFDPASQSPPAYDPNPS